MALLKQHCPASFVLTEYLPLHLEKTDWQEFVSPEMKDRIRLSMTLTGSAVSIILCRWRRWPRCLH